MPRTSAPSSKRRSSPSSLSVRPLPVPISTSDRELQKHMGSQSATVTIVWILLLAFSLGGALVLFQHTLELRRLSGLDTVLQIQDLQLQTQDLRVTELEQRMDKVDPPVAKTAQPVSAPVTTDPASGVMADRIADVLQVAASKSPSGALTRGAYSADGSKYAGYNDVTAGKRGISVELIDSKEARKIRYLVLFSSSESTGIDTVEEPLMSVRWKDAQTIEYDVLLKKSDGITQKEVRTVNIYY